MTPIADESETLKALGLATDATEASQVCALLEPVTAMLERLCNRGLIFGDRVEDLSSIGGQTALPLWHTPVQSITSVTDRLSGSVLAASAYEIEGPGLLRRVTWGETWEEGKRRWRVAYCGGPLVSPPELKTAFFDTIQQQMAGQGGIASEKDGDYAYTLATATADGLPESARAIVRTYRSRLV